jgi:serine/threonine-protein kinase
MHSVELQSPRASNLLRPPPGALQGLRVGEYVLEECIDPDGVEPVYRAVHPLIRKEVAIKVLRQRLADGPEVLQQRLAEARAVNALHHRGILDLLGFGTLPDGQQYLMVELLQGHTLAQELERRGCLPLQEVLVLLEEVLAALDAAHGVGVAHRELTLANIFLAEQPDGTRYVKLLGFGLSGVHARHVSPEANLQTLGALAFQLLTGHRPAPGPAPLLEVPRRSEVPPALEALLLQLLSRQHESARAVRHQLALLRGGLPQDGAPAASPTRAVPHPSAPSHGAARKRMLARGLLLFCLLGLGVGFRACEEHVRTSSLLDIQLP